MSRPNKYRGKHIETGEWVCGYLIGTDVIVGDIVEFDDEYFNTEFWYKVDPETVGQYTGLQDRNGKEIYEGDIIKRVFEVNHPIYDNVSLGLIDNETESGYFIGVVKHRPSEGYILNQCSKFDEYDVLISKRSGVKLYPKYAEVIGNVFDHPHLLKGDDTDE